MHHHHSKSIGLNRSPETSFTPRCLLLACSLSTSICSIFCVCVCVCTLYNLSFGFLIAHIVCQTSCADLSITLFKTFLLYLHYSVQYIKPQHPRVFLRKYPCLSLTHLNSVSANLGSPLNHVSTLHITLSLVLFFSNLDFVHFAQQGGKCIAQAVQYFTD